MFAQSDVIPGTESFITDPQLLGNTAVSSYILHYLKPGRKPFQKSSSHTSIWMLQTGPRLKYIDQKLFFFLSQIFFGGGGELGREGRNNFAAFKSECCHGGCQNPQII